NATVQANFTAAVIRTLTIDGTGTGTGTVVGVPPSTINCLSTAGSDTGTCLETVTDGTVVTLTATPAANSSFTGWTNCDSVGPANVCTQTVTGGDETVQANFTAAVVNRTLTIDGTGTGTGTVVGAPPSTINCTSTAGTDSGTCLETVTDGTVVTLTATPAANSTFTGWTNCDSVGPANVCTQTVTGGDATVQANFTA